MSTTHFERNDHLDDLTSEELEEQAFGPDPSGRRTRKTRRQRKKASTAVVATPPAPPVPATSALTPTTKFCYACGAEVDARAEVCRYCGVRQPELPAFPGDPTKSKGGATLLALFLGGVGAHRFYLGQPKVGLAMLLFCWTLIPSMIGVVDALRYVFMSDRRFTTLYRPEPPTLVVPPRPVRRLSPAADLPSPAADETEPATPHPRLRS